MKESDRLSATAALLAVNGVQRRDRGRRPDRAWHRPSARRRRAGRTHMDHRIAMSALVLGLATEQPVPVDDAGFIDTSFPGFVGADEPGRRGAGAAADAAAGHRDRRPGGSGQGHAGAADRGRAGAALPRHRAAVSRRRPPGVGCRGRSGGPGGGRARQRGHCGPADLERPTCAARRPMLRPARSLRFPRCAPRYWISSAGSPGPRARCSTAATSARSCSRARPVKLFVTADPDERARRR